MVMAPITECQSKPLNTAYNPELTDHIHTQLERMHAAMTCAHLNNMTFWQQHTSHSKGT